jgi:hypothetical protein
VAIRPILNVDTRSRQLFYTFLYSSATRNGTHEMTQKFTAIYVDFLLKICHNSKAVNEKFSIGDEW